MNQTNRPFWWPDAQGFVIGAVLIIVAICVFYRMTHASTADDKVLDMMLTILFSTCLVAIVNYLFGSSRSSANKDDALISIAGTPSPTQPAPGTVTTTATAPATITAVSDQPAPPQPPHG